VGTFARLDYVTVATRRWKGVITLGNLRGGVEGGGICFIGTALPPSGLRTDAREVGEEYGLVYGTGTLRAGSSN
jgi:hypothetical protein